MKIDFKFFRCEGQCLKESGHGLKKEKGPQTGVWNTARILSVIFNRGSPFKLIDLHKKKKKKKN